MLEKTLHEVFDFVHINPRCNFGACAALKYLQAHGVESKAENVARLSPLGFEHINFFGRYYFSLDEQVARVTLRPLRDPSRESDLGLW